MARSVIVGDVHGCAAELEDLLDRVGFGAGDALHFVGDLVARGPDGERVLDRARELGASVVRGNHEQRLLDVRAARARGERGPKAGPSHERLLGTLSPRHWKLLESLPLHCDLPEHDLRIVHAGVVPGLPIEEHEPWALLHMRTLDAQGEPSDERDGTLWGKRYRGPPHVVFGHNAVDGLQLHAYATGLDTGCVYGGELSALVLPRGAPVPPVADRRDAIVSVRARRAYVAMRKGEPG